jgi:hypothetical protein
MTGWKMFVGWLLATSAAHAADCDAVYDMDALFEDLATSEEALRTKNYVAASQTALAMRGQLDCLEQIMPVIIAGRVYRAMGAGLSLGGDDAGEQWLLTAAEVDPTFEYGIEDVPEGHPARALWNAAVSESQPDPVELEGKTLADGKHFIDGRRVNFPVATEGRFHVYQWVSEGVHSWVIEGVAFPDEAFGGGVVASAEPEDSDERVDPMENLMAATVVKQKNWPGERVALVAGGSAAFVTSGLMYALSAGAHNNFSTSATVSDMDKYKSQANTLFVGSGISAAAGAGALTFGALFFVIDGDPRPTLDIRF